MWALLSLAMMWGTRALQCPLRKHDNLACLSRARPRESSDRRPAAAGDWYWPSLRSAGGVVPTIQETRPHKFLTKVTGRAYRSTPPKLVSATIEPSLYSRCPVPARKRIFGYRRQKAQIWRKSFLGGTETKAQIADPPQCAQNRAQLPETGKSEGSKEWVVVL
jgi:hypothetical protein